MNHNSQFIALCLLVMDLEVIITCCRMLTHKVDSEISEFYLDGDNTLESWSKVSLTVKKGKL
jgi:guanine nucleotide-binding protein G(i) subunit alpha